MLNFINNFIRRKKSQWHEIKYPPKIRVLPLSFILLILILFIETSAFLFLSAMFINTVIKIILLILYSITIIKTFKQYRTLKNINKNGINKKIENSLVYLIHSLKLFDEELFEVVVKGRHKTEKRIVRTIGIYYREESNKIFIRIAKTGDRFTQIASNLGENIESAIGLELESTNATVDYFEYVFKKFRDRRIELNSSLDNQKNSNSDILQISGNISYELSKVPHSLIVGGTGSGKSFFIFGKIIQYLKLTPKADLRIIDPKKADLSLLRFVKGFENKVATEPNQICRILREAVELMEERYEQYFSNVSAFGKTYRDFDLPVVIIIFDEFSAFMHSVDKKVAKEALDYVFTLVMKGRQAGCIVEILMQRPSADDLPTNIRSQMGFKAGLGAMDSIGYNMIFDTNNVEYKTVTEKGGGYIQIDGVHTTPIYFESPYIPKGFDFIAEIEKLMDYTQKSDTN